MTLRFAASSLTPKSGGPDGSAALFVSGCVDCPDYKRPPPDQNSEVKWKRMSLKFSCARARA